MAHTTIADLWTPDVWIRGADEAARTLPSLLTSGIAIRTPTLDAIAAGPGVSAQIPYFKDISDTAETVQVEDTAPSVNNITGGRQVGTILNREAAFGANALSAQVSGEDPIGGIVRQLGLNRQKRTQLTLLSALRGLFNIAGAPAAAAPLSANRADHFAEAGASPASDKLIDSTKFNNACALLGELQDSIRGGAIWMHPNVRAALLNQDSNSFERASEGAFMVERYKGIPVHVSLSLVRSGGTSGVVYDTYVFAPGVVGWGEKPQVGDHIDVASLAFEEDKAKNRQTIYDRRRYLVHVNGTKWKGTPAGQSATNTELATPANWELAFQTADRVGVLCIRTNG